MVMLLSAASVRADYPIGRGRSAIIGNYSYYYSNKFFNNAGKITNFQPGENFQSHGIGFNFAHGIGRNVDIMLAVPIVFQTLSTPGLKSSNNGLADISLGLSFHIPFNLYKNYFTIKAIGILPTYSNQDSTRPFLGFGSKGATIDLGYSFSPFNEGFALIEAGYTRFFDEIDGPEQYKGSISIGKMINQNTNLNFTFSHLVSRSADITFNPNLAVNRNYSAGKIALGIRKRITRTVSPSLTAFYNIYGKNLGVGTGVIFSLIMTMP